MRAHRRPLGVLALLLVSFCAPAAPRQEGKPDISANSYGMMGYRTSIIERIVSEGLRFTEHLPTNHGFERAGK